MISLQYKDSKLELRRQEISAEPKLTEIGASANPSDRPALIEKEVARPSSAEDAKDAEDDGKSSHHPLFDLMPAVERQDISLINEIFDGFKNDPPFGGNLPYELEVWRHSELLAAGSSSALDELQRIEREDTKGTDASEVLARYFLKIGAYPQASAHIQVMFSRASNDERAISAVLLQVRFLDETAGVQAAIKFLLEKLPTVETPKLQARLYAELASKYSNQKEQMLAIAAYEEVLKRDVQNEDARFQLAYLYGEIESLQTLSVRHYRILIQQNRRYWSIVLKKSAVATREVR